MQAMENLSMLHYKQEVPDDVCLDLGFCLKPPEVEQLAICTVPEVDSNVTVSESVSQHCGKHEAEQCWCQDATLLDAVRDRKWLRCLTVVLNLCFHASVELLHHGDKLPWASVLGHDLPLC